MTKAIYKKQKQVDSVEHIINQLTLLLKQGIQSNLSLDSDNPESERAIFVSRLRKFYDDCRKLVESILTIKPMFAPKAIGFYTQITDKIVIATTDNVAKYIHPIANPTKSEKNMTSIPIIVLGPNIIVLNNDIKRGGGLLP